LGDIARHLEAWEAEHPGASSFSYVRDDPYPCTYEVVPNMLEGAAYEAEVDLGEGATCFCLSKSGRPIYLRIFMEERRCSRKYLVKSISQRWRRKS
jgi:hypothetical protein